MSEKAELQHFRDRVHAALVDAEETLSDLSGTPGPEAESTRVALRQLQNALVELQVAEEELLAQSEELTSAYEALVRERERSRQLFLQAPVGYVVTDTAGVIRELNRAASMLLAGADRRSLQGKPMAVYVARPDVRSFRDAIDLVADGSRVVGRIRLSGGNGTPQPVHVTAVNTGRPRRDEIRWMLVPDTGTATDGDQQFRLTARRLDGPAGGGTSRVLALPVEGVVAHTVSALTDRYDHLVPVAVAEGGSEPLEMLASYRPDVVVMDLTDRAAVDLLTRIRERFPAFGVVAMIPADDERVLLDALAAGAHGVVPLDGGDERLSATVTSAAHATWTIPPELSDLVRSAVDARRLVATLDPDSRRLLALVTAGASSAQIADAFYVSTRTAKRRVAALMRELDVATRQDLAVLAGRAGVPAADPPPASVS